MDPIRFNLVDLPVNTGTNQEICLLKFFSRYMDPRWVLKANQIEESDPHKGGFVGPGCLEVRKVD